MDEQKRRKSRRGETKLIPPKKDKMENLSRDEVRSINKKKNHRKRKIKRIAALCVFALAVILITQLRKPPDTTMNSLLPRVPLVKRPA